MHRSVFPLALLMSLTNLVDPVQAQTYFTSPPGFLSTLGNATFFGGSNRRYMGIEGNLGATAQLFKTFSLRRKSGAALTTSADVTLDLGSTTFRTVSAGFDSNYQPNTRKRVFSTKTVNWTLPAVTTTPAPWDLIVTLDAPYLELGLLPTIWDLQLQNVTTTFSIDRAYYGARSSSASNLGMGCSGFSLGSRMENNGAGAVNFGMRLRSKIDNGPANAPVSLSVALQNANATVPGWCTTLHAVPLLIAPLGVTNASGATYNTYFNAPFTANAVGVNLVTQAFTTTGGSISLSNGTTGSMPSSSNATSFDATYIWQSLTSTSTTTLAFHGGSILVRFGT